MALREASLEWFVGYGDVDHFGGVAWDAYAEWASRANSALWKANRADPPDVGVMRSVEITFHAPAAFEDTLTVTARYVKAGRTSFTCEVDFAQPDGTQVATAELRMVSIDPDSGQATEVPAWLQTLRR